MSMYVTVLKEARRLVDEVGWTRHAEARDANDNVVDWDSADATCFCMVGSIHKAYENVNPEVDDGPDVYDIISDVSHLLRSSGITEHVIIKFNDNQAESKEEVLAAFDAVIKTYEAEAS